MAKKPTTPCDRCGARLDHIPDKCPHCGEIIRDRMNPFIRERVEEIFKFRPYSRIHAIIFALTGILFSGYSIYNYIVDPGHFILFPHIPILYTFPAAIICLKERNYYTKKPGGILSSQYLLLATYIVVLFLGVKYFESSTIIMICFIMALVSFIGFLKGFETAYKKPRNSGWLIFMILEAAYVATFLILLIDAARAN
jgi:hypothetical protein